MAMTAIDSSRQKHSVFRHSNKYVTDLGLKSSLHLPRLLLIDDDRSLAALIAEYFGPAGFAVTPAFSGEDGIRLARQQYFLLIILDVMLPGIDGFEVLKRIRRASEKPILMLTTRGAANDRIRGLESGADDYLPKPFQPEELLARIHSILRRTLPKGSPTTLTLGDITINDLERDADDYLPKPFQPEELLARIHSILRRTLPKGSPTTLTLGDITINDLE